MNKRICCLILVFVLVATTISSAITVSAEEVGVQEVTLSMFSNMAPDKSQVEGFYKSNNFYVNLTTLCEISGAKIQKEDAHSVHISTNQGCREYTIFFDKQILVEKNCEEQNITMPTIVVDQEKCVSVLHFLRYIGADVQLDNSKTQLKVFVRYNIFDAIADCANNDIGNYFWWDEVDYGDKSIEDKLINAGVVALINRESNIFKMMFDAEGIARESIEDALISITQNEGQNSINDNNGLESLNNLNDLYNIETDVVDFVLEAYKSDATKKFGDFIDKFSSVSSFASSASVNILNAVESVKQFDNISETQISLMQNTILKHSNDSPLLCGEWDIVLDAAKNINTRVENAYANTYSASYDLLEKTAYDTLNIVTDVPKEPVSLAWDGAILAMKLIPYTSDMIDKKTQLYNGYNCSIIQCIANELFVKAYSDLYYNNYLYSQPSSQLEHLNQMKSSLILQYKSTLTTRERLISSQFLTEDYINLMQEMNKETAVLLNKLENCEIVFVGLEPLVEEELSWLENFETNTVLSPESAVEIYMANKNVWIENPEYMPMQGYGYCLLDLNFDGVLELINSVNDGSGRYSYNKFYRLNLNKLTVEEFQPKLDQREGGIDYYYLAHNSKLLKNKSTGNLFYLFEDYLRVSTEEGVESYAEVYMKDNILYENSLFSEYWHPDYDNNTTNEIREYNFNGSDISKSEYEQKTGSFYAENTDLNLVWECISGSNFDKGTDNTQKQLLFDAYRSFSYDGFSFNDVATYDITLESTNKEPQFDKEKARQYSMVDYYGMTIDDITELWGSDYTIMNGLIGGGWGGIYYEDNRCPFIFCFKSVGIPSSCSGDEVLSGVVVYPKAQDEDFFAIDNIKIVCSHSEVSQKIAGESYTNELYGGQSYSCELKNGAILVFTWTNSNTIPSEISTTFN